MRYLLDSDIDIFRVRGRQVVEQFGSERDHRAGKFKVPSVVDGEDILVIASNGEGWDHVSVSRRNRCPNWAEMEQIKRLFFRMDEVAMQLHVATKDHINVMSHCLHLWRPHDVEIPLPPKEFV